MDKIRQKAQSLLEKLHDKYGIQSKHHIHLVVATMGKKEGEDTGLQDHWYLVDTHGQKFRLPKTMLFLGREECDVVVASQTVDKRHAVLTFDLYLNRFKVKDLSTTNGTYVNNSRIPEQEYVTLNHMDSVRLGQDAMMYHIEQGSQITNQGGQLPDPHFIPSWASRHSQDPATIHVHTHAMAECQGCIAEQNIEHTCSLRPEGKEDDVRLMEAPHHSMCHQQKHHHHHQHQSQQSHDCCKEHSQHHLTHSHDQHSDHQHHQPHSDHHPRQGTPPHRDKTNNASREEDSSQGDQTHDKEGSPEESSAEAPKLGRNTWPRKRQIRQLPHIGSIFDPDAADNPELSASEARPAGAAPAMYFVSFDDSVCNSSSNSSGKDVKRISRNNRNSLPPELATVKKGTPLYGQPSWWGDPDEDDEGDNSASSSSKRNGDKNSANKNTRPSNLGLSSQEVAGAGASGKAAARMDGERIRPVQSATYMEIPIKDDESPGSVDGSKDSGTPAKSVSSSLSKDSLSVSPDQRQSHASKSGKDQSPSAEVNPATSFTIDLDDPKHPPKKSLNIGSSLSEFVPTKIRKNFRERKDRTSSKVGSKESTPSKNSEERELSPMAQHKIDEIWSTVVEGKSKARLASVQATAGSSLRSPNLEDIDRLSELSEERRSVEREGDKKGIAKRPVPSKSPQMTKSTKQKSSSSTALSSSTKSPAAATATMAAAHSTASVNLSQYSDPTSYLIDRMFEGGSSSASDKEMTPEKKMYREAANYDKTSVMRKSAEKSVVRPIIDSTVSYGASASKNGAIDSPAKKAVRKPSDDDDDDLKITEDLSDEEIDEAEVKDDKEDKVSEAGTYTIEADSQEGEEEEEFARKRIDQVFGVVNVDNFDSEKPLIDPLRLASPGGYDNVYDDDDGNKTPLDAPSSFDDDFDDDDSPSLVDNDNSLLVDDLPEYEDQDTEKMAATDGMQTWVSQLTALTSHKANMSADGRASAEEGDTSLSKKPPQGISRKRAGTGRKLPSIPIDQSPVSSEQDLRGDDDSPLSRSQDLVVNGKNARISSQTRSRRMNNGFPDSVSQASSEGASPNTSSRSRGSVDTELLLQDTETVMAAMEARIGHKSGRERKDTYSVDSDIDNLSTVSLVNGDDDYVKPSKFKSPREALANRQPKDISAKSANNNSSSSSPASSGRKPVGRTYSNTVPPKSKSAASPRGTPSATGGTRRSVVSDVFSRRDSVDNDSIISDVSSETGDGSLSRSSSKGKGTITMTKPNRAFQLRRARADSFEEPTTPRSGKSVASSRSTTSGSSVRSSSVHGSSARARSQVDTNRSEATSLGAQIVRKSQNNTTQDRARRSSGTGVTRTDGGRNSLRLQRASSLTISQPSPGSTSAKKEPAKPHLRSTPTGKGSLSISGISNISSRSQSQPGSRSNSPKAAERLAWKRRKDYDPRRAVAEAKAKAKETGGSGSTRPKPKVSHNSNGRIIRSASFTNSAGLSSLSSLSVQDSMSSTQGFRAFLPFQTSHRSAHSADEDDSLVSTNSDKASYDALIVSSIYQISLKLKTSTDKCLMKLRDQNRVSQTPSPVDDFLSDSGRSEITAWKSANQELAGILKNLRKLERHVQMISTVLFPEDELHSEVSSALPHLGAQEKQKYYQEMKRIRSEIAGFQPIHHPAPDDNDVASPEMAELTQNF